jgi:hypothetical protein
VGPYFAIAVAVLTRKLLGRGKSVATAPRRAPAPPIARPRPPQQRPKPYLAWSSAWPKAQKPALHLMRVTGDVEKDLAALGALYKALTGKDPTPE